MLNWSKTTTKPVYSTGAKSYNASTGVTTTGPYTNYSTSTSTLSIRNGTSVNTPGFRYLKRYQLPDHPHQRDIAEVSYDDSALTRYDTYTNGNWGLDTYRGPAKHFGATVEWQIEPDDPYNKALERLFSELSLTKGSLAVTLAEGSRTASHIANTATRLYKAYRGLRRGRFDEFTNALGMSVSQKEFKRIKRRAYVSKSTVGNYREFAASTWLEYTYGWKPLVNDIYTQAENLANYMTERSNVVREAKGSARNEIDTVSVSSSASFGYPGKITRRCVATRRCGLTVKYKIDGQPSALDTFGITNPALVAWELVPFSFVVDWILPIGNFLEALTATHGLTFLKGTKTDKRAYDISSYFVADGIPSGTNPRRTWTGQGSGRQKKTTKSRTLLTSFPSVPLPQLKNPASFSHLASAISLLQVVFGKR